MKKFIALTLTMALGLSMFNCSDDDSDNNNNNNNNPSNVLNYDGEEYQLKSGVVTDYGQWTIDTEGIYNFDISLLDTEINIQDGDLTPENNILSGLYFELFTENQAGLEPGVYTYSNQEAVPNTFDYGDIVLNHNFETDEEEVYVEITSGTFTILENGTTYKLEFEGVTDEGAEFSGNYEGELLYLDYSFEEGRMASGATKTKGFSKRK